ncbi:TlpA family protein disulfide reductase [Luteimonas aestuarii]|uniref:TlpA family protein disulfide reductase n=1 Tax=Luteimonas aestuarii TaxID=453837 RepID=A0A4R5TR29_9GAMM|nr:TlpA disulfide reductase family protein [Luteimonas aestuarii]TDK21758.1 TlpA family protein disulfide reductase [Luteimonas aestuarii]
MIRHAVLPSLLVAAALLLAACKPPADTPAAQADAAPEAPLDGVVDSGDGAPDPGVEGRPEVPTLRIATIDGDEYDLADRRGKWVVVNFWATWCSPCLKEMPELSALDAMREHVEVIGLAYEEIEPEAMRAFLEKHPVVYPIAILDVYDPPADFATPRGLPMTYLIAPDGKVARQFLGPVTAKEIETAIANNGGPSVEA